MFDQAHQRSQYFFIKKQEFFGFRLHVQIGPAIRNVALGPQNPFLQIAANILIAFAQVSLMSGQEHPGLHLANGIYAQHQLRVAPATLVTLDALYRRHVPGNRQIADHGFDLLEVEPFRQG